MSVQNENIALVKTIYTYFQSGDVKNLLAQFVEDVAWHTPGFPNVPYAGQFKGHAQVAKFFDGLGKTAAFDRFEPKEFIAEGNRVVVLGSYSGKGRKSGRPFATDWAMVFMIRKGKVASFQEYFDTQNLGSAFTSPAMANA